MVWGLEALRALRVGNEISKTGGGHQGKWRNSGAAKMNHWIGKKEGEDMIGRRKLGGVREIVIRKPKTPTQGQEKIGRKA